MMPRYGIFVERYGGPFVIRCVVPGPYPGPRVLTFDMGATYGERHVVLDALNGPARRKSDAETDVVADWVRT